MVMELLWVDVPLDLLVHGSYVWLPCLLDQSKEQVASESREQLLEGVEKSIADFVPVWTVVLYEIHVLCL